MEVLHPALTCTNKPVMEVFFFLLLLELEVEVTEKTRDNTRKDAALIIKVGLVYS